MKLAPLLVALALLGSSCASARVLPARPIEVAPARMALPARLSIPALQLDVRVAPVGLADDGAMDVPGTADEVGWYELGARPGERGNAVVAGHNVWDGRPAAFVGLDQLRAGDQLFVTTSMNVRFPYVVERVDRYPAETAPVAEVFRSNGVPELTLITCIGDPAGGRGYPDRLVVRARAAG